jgi:hypothetical protein
MGEHVKSILERGKFVHLIDARIADIKIAKKIEGKEEKEIVAVPGIKGKIDKIHVQEQRLPDLIHFGVVEGTVISHSNNKVMLEEKYKIPAGKGWGSRKIPLMLKSDVSGNFTGARMFAHAKLYGSTPDGSQIVHGLVDVFRIVGP